MQQSAASPAITAKVSDKAGLAPGSLVPVGRRPLESTRIQVIDYNHDELVETEIAEVAALLPYTERDTVTWVNIEGLADIQHIEQIGSQFGVHALVLEDILNTHQRPKLEEYDDYLFIVLRKLALDAATLDLRDEQCSILVMANAVFTFSERTDDTLEPVKQRIRTSRGRFRSLGSDYLAYAVMDAIVDGYFKMTDDIDLVAEEIEEQLLVNPDEHTLSKIHKLKRELILMRRHIVPVRELVSAMLRSETHLIQANTQIYLRDVHDHALRVIDSLETFRDIASGMLDIYLSGVSNRMNEVMKVLTIFAAIFIPLTFIAGVYGMNFEHMPELKWRWGYPAVWIVFVVVTVCLYRFFKRRKWL